MKDKRQLSDQLSGHVPVSLNGVKDPVVLSLENISKHFPGVRALDNVSFDVRRGEVHALLGENGAGKSTLIKIVSGVYQPNAGRILVNGIRRSFASPAQAHQHGIATIHRELSLYPELSVAENIFMGHAPRNRVGMLDWNQMHVLSREHLASLDIHDLDVKQRVGSLSVGNRQCVEIAKALSQEVKILIMDEPTAALSGNDVEQLFHIAQLLRQRGIGVIYISHRLEEIITLADRVTVLRDGAAVSTYNVSDTSPEQLVSKMLGRPINEISTPKQASVVGQPVL